jgi:hypothetical protein
MGVMAMMVMMVSPVAMPVPKGSPYHHGRRAVHYWRRGHDYGRSRDDDRRRVYDRWRGSDHYWGGVHRDANGNGDPAPCVRGQRQSGNRQACQERTYPEPTVFVLHRVFSCMVSSEALLSSYKKI